MDKKNPRVSVIICSYTMERLKDVYEVVDSVMTQTLKPFELIVSVDRNEELFQRLKAELPPEVRLVLNEGAQGLSETRNVGIRASSGDIIAFIDDDAIAGKDWLYNLTQPFEDTRVMAVGGRAVPLWPEGNPPFWFPEEFDFIIGCTAHKKLIIQENNEVRNVSGCNMAFQKEVFERVGFWEGEIGARGQSQKGGEEAELCLRIKSKMPQAGILHEARATVCHKVHPQRASLRYVLGYCLGEGFTRARMRKFASRFVDKPLAAENVFLRRLLFISLSQRLKRFYRLADLTQAGMIIANVLIIGVGYFLGRCKYR